MQPSFRPATKADAAALAVLVDIAGEGMPATCGAPRNRLASRRLEIGRERARAREGGFSYSNAIVAEIDGEIAASLVGYRLEDPYDLGCSRRDAGNRRAARAARGEGARLLVCERARDLPRVSPHAGSAPEACSPSPKERRAEQGAVLERDRRKLERGGCSPLCERRLLCAWRRAGDPVSGMSAQRRLGADGKIAYERRLSRCPSAVLAYRMSSAPCRSQCFVRLADDRHPIRSGDHRRGARRLCRRHPRGAARPQGRDRRARASRRHLPQLGLHPDQGAAAHLRALHRNAAAPASSVSPPTMSASISPASSSAAAKWRSGCPTASLI